MRTRKRETIGTRLHRLYFWLWDGLSDRLDPNITWRTNAIGYLVEKPGVWILCKVYGHEATPDQCGIPEHDFCVWCNRPMPCMARR